MYKKKDDVSQLVEALTSSERRYFALFSKAFGRMKDDALFMQLFHVLKSGENEVSGKLNSMSPQVLTTTKARLYKNVLKSMRCMHDKRSIGITIQNQLAEVEILYYMNLPEQGLVLLRKSYQLARHYEQFILLLQVLEWEKKLNTVLDQPGRKMETIIDEERQVMEKFRQITDLETIYYRMKMIKKEYGYGFYVKGEIQRQLENEVIRPLENLSETYMKSDKAFFYHNYIYALYYRMIFDYQKSYRHSRHLIGLIGGKLPHDYIEGILEHVKSSVCIAQFEEALDCLSMANDYAASIRLNRFSSLIAKVETYNIGYRLVIYKYMGNVEKIRAVIRQTEDRMAFYDKALPFEMQQVTMGNLMFAYLSLGDMARVDDIYENLLCRDPKSFRVEILGGLYLFRLFQLLQSQTYVLLPSAASSAIRYFRKFRRSGMFTDLELPIATLFVKEQAFEHVQVLRPALMKVRDILLNFLGSTEGIENFNEHYTQYLIWIDSLINKRPFHQEAASWYKRLVDTRHPEPDTLFTGG